MFFLLFFFWIFISIQGVQGATREGPEPILEVKNDEICIFSKTLFFSFIFLQQWIFWPGGGRTLQGWSFPAVPSLLQGCSFQARILFQGC